MSDAEAERSRPYQVTPYQLGQSLHDYFPCPFNHSESSRKYVPRDECARLRRLVTDSWKVLDWSLAQQVVPGLRTTAFDEPKYREQAVQPEQTTVLDLLDVRQDAVA